MTPCFRPSRRALMGAALSLPVAGVLRAAEPDLAALPNLAAKAVPISVAERRARIAKAQGLMRAHGVDAVVIEPGASLAYFTGVRWGRSERITAAVLTREGEALVVTPFFEEPSVRETLAVPAELRVWQEDESPHALIAAWLRERRLTRTIGIEETARFFVSDGLAAALPGARFVSANPVVRACRMIKSPAEIALMQVAADVTVAAYRFVHPRVERGMAQAQIGAMMAAATERLGGRPLFQLVLIGEGSAYPHGTEKESVVAPGAVVLMDCGAMVEGYQSDISRTFVHGRPSAEVARVWEHMAEGQRVAFAVARLGATCGSVDDAVRARYEALGYGPGYRLPGLSHRTGHGIGMDGHEPVNLVRGETTRLAEGMCFSNEPGLYLPGKFGVRLEDCFHMSGAGPRYFSEPLASIERPV